MGRVEELLGEVERCVEEVRREGASYVLVAFRVSEENSVYYRKCKSMEELKRALEVAFEAKDADFVSIRKVRKNA